MTGVEGLHSWRRKIEGRFGFSVLLGRQRWSPCLTLTTSPQHPPSTTIPYILGHALGSRTPHMAAALPTWQPHSLLDSHTIPPDMHISLPTLTAGRSPLPSPQDTPAPLFTHFDSRSASALVLSRAPAGVELREGGGRDCRSISESDMADRSLSNPVPSGGRGWGRGRRLRGAERGGGMNRG